MNTKYTLIFQSDQFDHKFSGFAVQIPQNRTASCSIFCSTLLQYSTTPSLQFFLKQQELINQQKVKIKSQVCVVQKLIQTREILTHQNKAKDSENKELKKDTNELRSKINEQAEKIDELTAELECKDELLSCKQKIIDELLTPELKHKDDLLSGKQKIIDELTLELEHKDKLLSDRQRIDEIDEVLKLFEKQQKLTDQNEVKDSEIKELKNKIVGLEEYFTRELNVLQTDTDELRSKNKEQADTIKTLKLYIENNLVGDTWSALEFIEKTFQS